MSVAPPRYPAGGSALVVDTAAGRMIIEATARGISRVDRIDDDGLGPGREHDQARGVAADHLARLADQLRAYCAGELHEFDVPVDWAAAGVDDEFSREVYREIQHIPYGETSTYGQISMDAGRPRHARRVGRLCTLVPVAFVVPVHRVIRADGGMGNCPQYRRRLLEHERHNLASTVPVSFGSTVP